MSVAPKVYRFQYVTAPHYATQQEAFDYLEKHYWDKFDFADTIFIAKVDTAEMMKAYAGYFLNFVRPNDQQPMAQLMKRASASEQMFRYFGMLAEKMFHDPNSPFRNDEQCIPVLEAQIEGCVHYRHYSETPRQVSIRFAHSRYPQTSSGRHLRSPEPYYSADSRSFFSSSYVESSFLLL